MAILKLAFLTAAAGLAIAAMPVHASNVTDLTASLKGANADRIKASIAASPALSQQLDELATSGKVTAIVIADTSGPVPGSRFSADVVDGKMVLASGLLSNLSPHPRTYHPGDPTCDNVTFVLGHLAYHAAHDADVKAASDAQAKAALNAPRASDGGIDATAAIMAMRDAGMDEEARAFIQGWNDVVDEMTVANGGRPIDLHHVSKLLNDLHYAYYFAATMYQPGGSIKWNPDSGQIEADDHNVKTLIGALGQSPVANIR